MIDFSLHIEHTPSLSKLVPSPWHFWTMHVEVAFSAWFMTKILCNFNQNIKLDTLQMVLTRAVDMIETKIHPISDIEAQSLSKED